MKESRTYLAIDLKSFYASVECVERGLNPLTTNLVVADESRTDKTICLAVSPSLKALGIGGRPRLFEVKQRVNEINNRPRPTHKARGAVSFIVAPPRMALYIKYSTRVHNIYLKYVAPEDIHVYSIDEVFMDVSEYLRLYNVTAHQMATTIIRDVLKETGITATAGIGPNLYLCKVAMDIVAKHIPADKDGVRIAELDEVSYRQQLWDHRPLTDFWRIGRGVANRLAPYGIDTMGKIARCSVNDEDLLYKLFGINAELIIDHAWGWEPCTIAHIKAYRPSTHSLSHGQVLTKPYTADKARVVIEEMANAISLELTDKHLVANKMGIDIDYDAESLRRPDIRASFRGKIHVDHYGRTVPKSSNGGVALAKPTALASPIVHATLSLYDNIVNTKLLIRRLTLTAGDVADESIVNIHDSAPRQLDLFADDSTQPTPPLQHPNESEQNLQRTILKIKNKFGKNAILKGISYSEDATARQRNQQIGGHKA
ncbi:MAG: Y-family DNA polymerase [Bacteroidaceae bacterium]|nr:Y-family DNA polymerase [Bacteroidaceae bacterium]